MFAIAYSFLCRRKYTVEGVHDLLFILGLGMKSDSHDVLLSLGQKQDYYDKSVRRMLSVVCE